MDDSQLSHYVLEVQHQALLATVSAYALNESLHSGEHGPLARAERFGAAQGILTAGAQISKLLWVHPNRKWSETRTRFVEERAAALQEIIKPSELLNDRSVRNSVEHFDERLDAMMLASPQFIVSTTIAQRSLMSMPPETVWIRHLDPLELEYTALDKTVRLNDLFQAIGDAGDAASDWLEARRLEQEGTPTPPAG